MLSTGSDAAKAPLVNRIRRSIGMSIHRANANLILNRVNLVGPHAAGAATRRAQSEEYWWGQAGPQNLHWDSAASNRYHGWNHY